MKRVVVIGGGFAGAYIAKQLEDIFRVRLIDSKDYFEYTPGILRTIVSPTHIRRVQILHNHYLHHARFNRDQVVKVTESHVHLKGGLRVNFDYLVIASGCAYQPPFKKDDMVVSTRADILKYYQHRLRAADDILVIGGGLVGVELVGELLDHHEDKNITLMEGQPNLIARMPQKAQKYVEKYFRKKKVNLLLGKYVESAEGNIFCTHDKFCVKTDLPFFCVGLLKPNTQFMKGKFKKCLTDRGYVKVNHFLQVEGHPHIFCVGDANSVAEEKTAQNAEKHAEIVIENIMRYEKNEYLKEYTPEPRPMLISLGKWKAMYVYKDFCSTGIIPSIMKHYVEWRGMQRFKKWMDF